MAEVEDQVEAELQPFLRELHNGEMATPEEQQQTSWWSWLFRTSASSAPKFIKLNDIEYASSTGTQHPKHKLDIYIPNTPSGIDGSCPRRPVLIHIHGGGWVRGAFSHLPRLRKQLLQIDSRQRMHPLAVSSAYERIAHPCMPKFRIDCRLANFVCVTRLHQAPIGEADTIVSPMLRMHCPFLQNSTAFR